MINRYKRVYLKFICTISLIIIKALPCYLIDKFSSRQSVDNYWGCLLQALGEKFVPLIFIIHRDIILTLHANFSKNHSWMQSERNLLNLTK